MLRALWACILRWYWAYSQAVAYYRWRDGNLLLSCHLQPRASKNEFAGYHGDRLKIRVKAPPIDGKANTALIKFLAKEYGVSKASVTIDSGEASRQKLVCIKQPEKIPKSLDIKPPPQLAPSE